MCRVAHKSLLYIYITLLVQRVSRWWRPSDNRRPWRLTIISKVGAGAATSAYMYLFYLPCSGLEQGRVGRVS